MQVHKGGLCAAPPPGRRFPGSHRLSGSALASSTTASATLAELLVEAVPDRDYPVTPQSGPWLICAASYTGTGSPTFKIIAANGKQSIASTALAQDTITSIGSADGVMNVQLKGRAAVPYTAIQAVL